MTTSQQRVPSGVPTGGQFSASAHAESGVDLAAPDRDALIARALGPGEPLTADQQRLLGILLDPETARDSGYADDFESMLEEVEYNGEDQSYDGARSIAERLDAHYRSSPGDDGAGDFNFELIRSDYGVESYNVGVYLGHGQGSWLNDVHESKYLDTDRITPAGTSGLRRALAVAEVIDTDFQSVRAKAERLGLLKRPVAENVEDAQRDAEAARRLLREAENRVEAANLTSAAHQIRDQYPDAQYLVLCPAEDESWSVYAHAILGADRKAIAYPEDTFADARTQRLQQTVMHLPVACPATVSSEMWGDPDNEAYMVDLDDVLPGGTR